MNIPKAVVSKAKSAGKSAVKAVKNVRLGPATGSYKSNTLGQTASLMKSTFNSITKPGKK